MSTFDEIISQPSTIFNKIEFIPYKLCCHFDTYNAFPNSTKEINNNNVIKVYLVNISDE